VKAFTPQLRAVQQAAEDFEWYPTTDEIIAAMKRDVTCAADLGSYHYSRGKSFLDIGAGNGKVLDAIRGIDGITELHAIEKSNTHLQSLAKDVFILGVDFWKTSLIDKTADVIFSNPPYSEFAEWTAKILREAPPESVIYLVIPERWEKSPLIEQERAARKMTASVLGNFDFYNAEDRTARAKVHLVRFRCSISHRHDGNDPFVRFFDDAFPMPERADEKPLEEQVKNAQLVNRLNLIEALCMLYDARMAELQGNYQAVCKLDADILKEFEISRDGLIKSLKMKLATAKTEYWRRLFDGLEEITKRLTAESRKRMMHLMESRTGIEFNRDNAYAVVMWSVKNANGYFDEQFMRIYEAMVDGANVENYMSNSRIFKKDRFRYYAAQDSAATHFRLKVGHRMVVTGQGGLATGYSDWSTGITERGANFLCDLIVVARNLGFHVIDKGPERYEWKDSDARVIRFLTKEGNEESLYRVRAFSNGNFHLQFNPDLIHAMNISYGLLRGWLRNDMEAAKELEISPAIAAEHFKPAFRLGMSSLPQLGFVKGGADE